jgi:hypothetical protein
MFFLSHKAPLSRLLLAAMVPFFLVHSPLNAEQQTTKTDPAAENWYQVEVILFDQKTISDSESAPKEVQIGFPQNLLELSNKYPNTGIMRRPIFDRYSSASMTQSDDGNLTQRLLVLLGAKQITPENYNGGSTIPETSIPYHYQDNEDISDLEPFPLDTFGSDQEAIKNKVLEENNKAEFNPVYEQPYQILDKKLRNLNDTAKALNRRKYKVRFHQAWRFQIDAKEQSPWVLIKTKPEAGHRQAIEGSLRFYKSRYLHFESDLWRINFSTSENTQITLPEIPRKKLNNDEKSLLKVIRFSKKLKTLTDDLPKLTDFSVSEPDDNYKGIEDALAGYDLSDIAPLLDSPRDTTSELTEAVSIQGYPISEIWPIKQSKRLQEDEVYYIDHPFMGALVTIKSFEPVPINMPPQLLEPEQVSELKVAE